MKHDHKIAQTINVLAVLGYIVVWSSVTCILVHNLIATLSLSLKYHYLYPGEKGLDAPYIGVGVIGGAKFMATFFLLQSLVGWIRSMTTSSPALACQALVIYSIVLIYAAEVDPTQQAGYVLFAQWIVLLASVFVLFCIYMMFNPPRQNYLAVLVATCCVLLAFGIDTEFFPLSQIVYFIREWRLHLISGIALLFLTYLSRPSNVDKYLSFTLRKSRDK